MRPPYTSRLLLKQAQLSILSLCNHEVVAEYTDEDPLERWRVYGSIRNQHIKV